jgi:putative ABC transport system permease protein
MVKHNLIVAIRNIIKSWQYSVINIGGLSIGITCAIFIYLYVNDELAYDRFFDKADRIYRVNRFYNSNEVNEDAATLEFPGGPELAFDYPDMVEKQVRFFNFMRNNLFFEYEKQGSEKVKFNESNFFFVDSTLFDIFSFPFLEGDPNTSLDRPNTIVITQSTSRRYFGNEPAMGKILRLEEGVNFEITGVIKDLPPESHFRIDMLGSMSTCRVLFGGQLPTTWIWNPCWTYVLLKPGIRPELLNEKLPKFYKEHYFDLKDQDVKLYLQPLTDIHLNSHHVYEMHPNSSMLYVYVLSIVAVIVLVLACINFMNLATASSAGRAKEIGIKKVLGSRRPQLAFQFLGEAIIQSVGATIFALLAVELLLNAFNNFTGKSISSIFLFKPETIFLSAGLSILVGLFAGFYPAFFLSSFRPLKVLKGSLSAGSKNALARKILVIVQFTISIGLIIGTLIVFSQLKFLRNAELGFNKEHIITFQNKGQLFRNYEAFKQELLQNKDILKVTGSEDVLGVNHNTRAYEVEGLNPGQNFWIPAFMVDWDFVETYGIEVIVGRAFSKDFPGDTLHAVMINETMVKDLGWSNESAIGKKVKSQDGDERVIGIFRDLNTMSLHRPVGKFILDMFRRPQAFAQVISVKVKTSDYTEVLKYIQSVWDKFNPTRPFEYDFLDKQLDDLYKDEARFGKFSLLLTLLAILIASMGLLGLTSFLAEQRTREIGIRRVMGASAASIVKLMFSEFIILVSISVIISWPITYLVTTNWLEKYSKHIGTNWLLYVYSGAITLFIALLIVGYRALKTSMLNPADTLRYE